MKLTLNYQRIHGYLTAINYRIPLIERIKVWLLFVEINIRKDYASGLFVEMKSKYSVSQGFHFLDKKVKINFFK